jgi:protease YdgD
MMTRCWALLLVLALATPAHAQDSGLEALTRREQTLGWEAVGRVDLGSDGFCTGTLIASDMVLTAAHCVYDGGDDPIDPSVILFRAGYGNGTMIAQSNVARFVAHEGYDPSRQADFENVQHDVALLQLQNPILTAVAAPFAIGMPTDGNNVSVLSYARGREEVLSWQRSCTVKGRVQRVLAFNCDVTFGASGAPVFDLSGGRARIVSIVSGGMVDGDAIIGFGMELPGLVHDLKSALRAGRGVVVGTTAPGLSEQRRVKVGQGGANTGAKFVKP